LHEYSDPGWELVTDRVMGGLSAGAVERVDAVGTTATRLNGCVSLENNGGFVQMVADIAPPPAAAKGVAMMLAGNGETYNIHLRTTDLSRPLQSYRHEFSAPAQWTLCHFAFGDFKPHRTEKLFDKSRISRIGIVAIGRVFDADVSVGNVSYY